MQHFLKCDHDHFQAIYFNEQKCSIRFDDRNFKLGDEVIFIDYDQETKRASGESLLRHITHIQTGYGLPDGYVALSLSCEA